MSEVFRGTSFYKSICTCIEVKLKIQKKEKLIDTLPQIKG
jgi:hypothetical protein